MSYTAKDYYGAPLDVFAMPEGPNLSGIRMVHMGYYDALVDVGYMFMFGSRFELNNNSSIDFLVKIPVGAHVEFLHLDVETKDGPVLVDLYEGALVSANGTQGPVYNMNRQSSRQPSFTTYQGPTVTDPGSSNLYPTLTNGSKGVGGGSDRQGRLVLKENENYLLRLTNASGANPTTIGLHAVFGED